MHKQILEEEEEKKKIQNDIRILTERLSKVNESLSKKMASRNEFDRTIAETEAAYMKVTFRVRFMLFDARAPQLIRGKCWSSFHKTCRKTTTHKQCTPLLLMLIIWQWVFSRVDLLLTLHVRLVDFS